MDIIEKLTKLKVKVEEARSAYERAKGRMEMADKSLADAGFSSEQDLSNAINDLENKLVDMYKELEDKTAKFTERYAGLLK